MAVWKLQENEAPLYDCSIFLPFLPVSNLNFVCWLFLPTESEDSELESIFGGRAGGNLKHLFFHLARFAKDCLFIISPSNSSYCPKCRPKSINSFGFFGNLNFCPGLLNLIGACPGLKCEFFFKLGKNWLFDEFTNFRKLLIKYHPGYQNRFRDMAFFAQEENFLCQCLPFVYSMVVLASQAGSLWTIPGEPPPGSVMLADLPSPLTSFYKPI